MNATRVNLVTKDTIHVGSIIVRTNKKGIPINIWEVIKVDLYHGGTRYFLHSFRHQNCIPDTYKSLSELCDYELFPYEDVVYDNLQHYFDSQIETTEFLCNVGSVIKFKDTEGLFMICQIEPNKYSLLDLTQPNKPSKCTHASLAELYLYMVHVQLYTGGLIIEKAYTSITDYINLNK